MTKTKLVLANWKSAKNFAATRQTLQELESWFKLQESLNVRVGVAVSPVSLVLAQDFSNHFFVLAQDVSEFLPGAHTGTSTTDQLLNLGVDHSLVGHSERRMFEGETSSRVCAKTLTALKNNITPVFCFGETQEERLSQTFEEVLTQELLQLKNTLSASQIEKIIFAYEPVWAIGTGLTPSITDIENISHLTRDIFEPLKIKFIYGGSVNGQSAFDILKSGLIDGVLVGSASLEVKSFAPIILTAHQTSLA